MKGKNIKRELSSILLSLDAEHQNMAFVNENYTRAFVKLSDSYTWQRL